MVLPASDPIGGVSIISGTVSRKNKEAYFVGNGGTGSEREGGGQWAEDGGRNKTRGKDGEEVFFLSIYYLVGIERETGGWWSLHVGEGRGGVNIEEKAWGNEC